MQTTREQKVRFQPFIGKYFGKKESLFNEKVMVLGESHILEDYDPTAESNSVFTEGAVKDVIYNYTGMGDEQWQQTFLCFERALAGRVLEQEEREKLWESLMFYNYVQGAATQSREGVTDMYIEDSELAFKEVLEQYLPDKIIVWGERLYRLLPAWDGTEEQITVEGDTTQKWIYTIKGKRIPAMKVHHPSAPTGKQWDWWHKFYKEFLSENYLTNLNNQ